MEEKNSFLLKVKYIQSFIHLNFIVYWQSTQLNLKLLIIPHATDIWVPKVDYISSLLVMLLEWKKNGFKVVESKYSQTKNNQLSEQ